MILNCEFMNHWTIIFCQLFYLILQLCERQIFAGVCWENIDDTTKLCRRAFNVNMTQEECCAFRGIASVSWTPHTRSSNIFYWNYLTGGATSCQRCHKTCEDVKCDVGKVCRMVKGYPICICKPRCDPVLKSRGTVCGSDGWKYKNVCSLQRHNCKADRRVEVEYFGRCRRSCKRVNCENGKHCLEDQNGSPHCIACNDHCNIDIPEDPRNFICAVDGNTYKNSCDLKAAICRRGKSIRIAYTGECRENATCATVSCPKSNKCLIDSMSRKPVCVDCTNICLSSISVPICGTNGRTYTNYCEMQKEGCEEGVFISTKKSGACKPKKNHILEQSNAFRSIRHRGNMKSSNKTRMLRRREKKRRRHYKRHKKASKRLPDNKILKGKRKQKKYSSKRNSIRKLGKRRKRTNS